jgi:hypothetical protein
MPAAPSAAARLADPFAGLEPAAERWLRDQTDRLNVLLRRTAENLLDVGRLLAAVRDRLPDGQFRAWLILCWPYSRTTAYVRIDTARQLGPLVSENRTAIANLHPAALPILAADSTPPMVRLMAVVSAGRGRPITAETVRNMIREAVRVDRDNDPDPPPPPKPRGGVTTDALRLLLPPGERAVQFTGGLQLDPDDRLVVALDVAGHRTTGRDFREVVLTLARELALPPPPEPTVDPTDPALIDWCDTVSGGIARAFGFAPDSQEGWELKLEGQMELVRRCQQFDPAAVDPGSTAFDAFRGWAHQYIRSQCQREAERLVNGGTYRTRRKTARPPPRVLRLDETAAG